MKDVYAVLLLHSAGQKVTEENLGKVLNAAGVTEEATKLKAVCAALEGVNIDEAVKQAAVAPVAAAGAGGAAAGGAEAKKEEKKDEKSEAEKEAEAAEGLAALFG
jgi:large subunit ribosomal protein L12